MSTVMYGAPCVEKLNAEQKERVDALRRAGVDVTLAVVRVGDDPASEVYVRNKKNACARLGILSREIHLSADASQREVEDCLDGLSRDPEITGILLQLPLPGHLDEKKALLHISPEKDADGFRGENCGSLITGGEGTLPCTPRGILYMLKYYGVPLSGRNAVVVGRSAIVGKPCALMLLNENCTVTLCHSRTADLKAFTSKADILVAAVGKAGLITGDMLKEGCAVVDVGINRTEQGLKGDVDFDSASGKAAFISPVPGGVGKMTVAMLMENVIDLAEKGHKSAGL